MAENTKIEWADHTFNPWIGCTKVGPGCDHCYAAEQDAFRKWTPEGWGGPRRRTSVGNWQMPQRWDRIARQEGRRFRVFCASLADVFDNEVPAEWRADLFKLIDATPHLDWLLLTKRIGNVPGMLTQILRPGTMPPNVWLGATVVNQEEADRDIPKLLAAPARVRFLSLEPLLGPVDLRLMQRSYGFPKHITREGHCVGMPQGLHWVIAGGESGPGARPMHSEWARRLRDQCAAAGVPFLFKQWGEWLPIDQFGDGDKPGESDLKAYRKAPRLVLQRDGEVREAFADGAMTMLRMGKKAAGRLLDGRVRNAFPEVA